MSDLYRCDCGKLVYAGLDTMAHAHECEHAARFRDSFREQRDITEAREDFYRNDQDEFTGDDVVRRHSIDLPDLGDSRGAD